MITQTENKTSIKTIEAFNVSDSNGFRYEPHINADEHLWPVRRSECGSISVHQCSSAVCRNQSYATTKSVRISNVLRKGVQET